MGLAVVLAGGPSAAGGKESPSGICAPIWRRSVGTKPVFGYFRLRLIF